MLDRCICREELGKCMEPELSGYKPLSGALFGAAGASKFGPPREPNDEG